MIQVKYSVYLLKSEVSNRTYIGYTNKDVYLRLRKHNGELVGGAVKTKTGRPWKILLWVSGFPFERTALQYEFCIQHTKRHKRGTGVKNKIKIMKALLKQDKICSTSLLNSEFKRIIFFANEEIKTLWNSI